MKKITLIAALVMLGGSLFAYGPGGNGNGRDMMGPGMGPGIGLDIDWKVGTVVTTEYKKATGQVTTATTLWGTGLTFKAEGVEYQLWLPRTSALSTLKNGDTITVEGTFTTVKADAKVSPVVHPFKVTVNGKEVDLAGTSNYGRGGMMGGNGYRR